MSRRDKYIHELEINKASKNAIQTTLDSYLSATIVALKKEYGFGKTRIMRVLKAIENELEPVGSGMVGLDLYKEYAKEFTGVDIKEVTDYDL